MSATLTIQGLLAFDPTLLNDIKLPDGLDRDTVNAAILMECAPFEVLVPQPDLFKSWLKLFSLRRYPVWDKLYQSTIQRYDIMSDTESTETAKGTDTSTRTPNLTRTRTPNLTRKRTPDLTTSGQNGGTDTVEEGVSAFNNDDYANRQKQITTLGTTNTVHSTGTDTETESGTESTKDTGTEDIDRTTENTVTKTGRNRPVAELLEKEREAALFDVIHYIAMDIKCNFCILMY